MVCTHASTLSVRARPRRSKVHCRGRPEAARQTDQGRGHAGILYFLTSILAIGIPAQIDSVRFLLTGGQGHLGPHRAEDIWIYNRAEANPSKYLGSVS